MTDGLQWMPIFMGMTEHSCHTNPVIPAYAGIQ